MFIYRHAMLDRGFDSLGIGYYTHFRPLDCRSHFLAALLATLHNHTSVTSKADDFVSAALGSAIISSVKATTF